MWQTGDMKAYSIDLRHAVIAALERGMSRAEAADAFEIAPSTLKRWVHQHATTGSLDPAPIPGRPSVVGAALDAGLTAYLGAHPDATIAEHCARWEETTGQVVSPSSMRRAITRLGWTRKKRV